jgi:hypothetical protein
LIFRGSHLCAVAALGFAALLAGWPPAYSSVPGYPTPAGYSLTFRGALHGDASGGTVKGCAFDPLGLPKFAVRWTGFSVAGDPYDLYLDAVGTRPFRAGEPIPITNNPDARPGATLRITSGKRVFNKPKSGSVQLSPDGIGVFDAVLGPKLKGKPLTVSGNFHCLVD